MPTIQQKIQHKERTAYNRDFVQRFLSKFKTKERAQMPDSMVRPKEDYYNKLGGALSHPKPKTSSSLGKAKSLKGGEAKAAAELKGNRFRERHRI